MSEDRGMARLAGPGATSRGIDYARRGRATVESAQADAISGTVRGSFGIDYETTVDYAVGADGNLTRFGGRCSCPVGSNCKHAVALLLTALVGQGGSRFPRAAGSPLSLVPPPTRIQREPSPPAWESALSGLIGDGFGFGAEAAVEPLALAFELTLPARDRPGPKPASWYASHVPHGNGRLAVRPVCRGAKGQWIKTGVSWSDVTHNYARRQYRADQLRVLVDISQLSGGDSRRQYTASDGWLDLQSLDSASIWDLFAEAAEVHLGFVTLGARQPAVTVSSATAELRVDVGRDSTGLLLAPTVELDGDIVRAARSMFLGDPAHGIATWTLDTAGRASGITLARLDHRADRSVQQLYADGGLHIPAADEHRFLDEYVPALRQRHQIRSVDATLVLAPPQPAMLGLRLEQLAGHRIKLRWDWIYRAGATERRLPLLPAGESGRRDPVREGQVLSEVTALLAGLPELTGHTRLGVAPLAEATTAGRRTIDFISTILPLLAAHPAIEIENRETLLDYREADAQPVIALRSTPADGSRDWFDLEVSITLADVEIPFEQVFLALAQDSDVLILPDGGYISLDRDELRQLRTLIDEARGLQDRPDGPLQISRFQAGLWADLERIGVVDSQSGAWLERVREWQFNPTTAPANQPVGLLATLRPYQLDGYRWLNLLRENGLGGILADDMGLGKTIQALAMICRAREQAPDDPPFLVIAPTSVVGNWQAEAARFAPGLRSVVITETETRRGVALDELISGVDLVITSYTLFRLEFDAYEEATFSGLLLDEAQAVKNHQSKAFQCVKRLPVPVKFAITGTPIENNLMELWALFSLVAPGLFPHPGRFTEQYRTPIERGTDPEPLARLRRRIRPLMLRRTKEQVATDLPAKQEQVLELELEPGHRKVYQRHLQRERQKVLGLLGDLDKNRFAIFRSLMLLRQASIDPFLVDPANARVGSTKLTVLMELLEDVISEGHRTLIFSQFTGFLSRVRSRLDEEGIKYCYLDGSTRNRPAVLAEFREGTAPVFLISLKAGGVGLNLTEADYCILLDPWWNPATEAQAVDRTHRIGQTKKVMVYRLVSKDTIEEKVMALKESKSRLFAGVLSGDDDGAGAAGKGITASDIRALLA